MKKIVVVLIGMLAIGAETEESGCGGKTACEQACDAVDAPAGVVARCIADCEHGRAER